MKTVKNIKKLGELYLKFVYWLQSPVLLLLRVIWGTLFMMEGWYKFSDIPSNTSYFASLGFPVPELMVYLSASAEFFGGLFLVIGFLSRFSTIPLIITMIVAAIMDPSKAYLWGHGSDQTETFLTQIPLVFAYLCFVVLLFGPGKWSLDYKLKDKFFLCR